MYLIGHWGEKQEQSFHSVLWWRTSLHNHLPLSVITEQKHVAGLNTGVQLIQGSCVRKSAQNIYPGFGCFAMVSTSCTCCTHKDFLLLCAPSCFSAGVSASVLYCFSCPNSYQAMQHQSPCSVSTTILPNAIKLNSGNLLTERISSFVSLLSFPDVNGIENVFPFFKLGYFKLDNYDLQVVFKLKIFLIQAI